MSRGRNRLTNRFAAPMAAAGVVVAGVTGCGGPEANTSCDDYSQADPIARKMLVSDELQKHGLDYARTDLQIAVMQAVAQHCGPIDPFGHVGAQKNGDQPFAATVNWVGLAHPPG